MEISSIGAVLWTAAQTITITQVAAVVLVGVACLFAYTYWMNQAAAAASPGASTGASLASTRLPTPEASFEPGGAGGTAGAPSEPAAVSSPVKVRSEDVAAAFVAYFGAEFAKILEADAPLIKAFMLSELLPWIHMDAVEQDTDRAKFIGQIREMYGTLLSKLPEDDRAHFEGMVARREERDAGAERINVRADGNCGYTSVAVRVLLDPRVKEGHADTFPEDLEQLSHFLRTKAYEEAQKVPETHDQHLTGLLRQSTRLFLMSVCQNYMIASMSGRTMSDHELKEKLGCTEVAAAVNLKSQLENLLSANRADLNQAKAAENFDPYAWTEAILASAIGDIAQDELLNRAYISRMQEHADVDGCASGFWASPFEFELLARYLNVTIEVRRSATWVQTHNPVASGRGRPSLAVLYNGRDHYDAAL